MHAGGQTWLEAMRNRDVMPVARELGISEIGKTPSDWCLGPCPKCGAEKRHTRGNDRRGALNIPKGKPTLWACLQCEAKGDALQLVAYAIGGAKVGDLATHHRAEMREWCSRFLGIEPGAVPRVQLARAPMVRAEEAPPSYPPADEIAALWGACSTVTSDVDVRAWLASRGIDAEVIEALDAARALPATFDAHRWARHRPDPDAEGGTWAETGHRLAVPLYDAAGSMRSVLARRIVDREHGRKSTAPSGYQRAGLLMSCPVGAAMLAASAAPSNVIVCEGEADYLATVSGPARGMRWPDGPRPAVLGMFQGGWTAAHAARVPDGARVVIATDDDSEGDKYAARIVSTLEARARVGAVRLDRWRPTK